MPSEIKRTTRLAPRLQKELALLIAQEIKDPRVKQVILTRVDLSGDLSIAKIYFRVLENGDDEKHVREVSRGLESAARHLRRIVGQRMALQKAPELRFRYDAGLDAQSRVEEILEEIRQEDASRERDDESDES